MALQLTHQKSGVTERPDTISTPAIDPPILVDIMKYNNL